MGTQTYGKGTVQSSLDLNKIVSQSILQKLAALVGKSKITPVGPEGVTPQLGQINLTMAKFYRVTGSSTQHKGVIPDVQFPSLYPMDKIGEDVEPAALPWDEVERSNFKPVQDLTSVKAALVAKHEERMKNSVDYRMLQKDIEEMKMRQNEVSVTLNEAKLKQERDKLEANALARTNEIRASRGLAPLKKGDKVTKEERADFIEDESLQVLADLMQISRPYEKTVQVN
jgi:carboxyl-terminal processing protease